MRRFLVIGVSFLTILGASAPSKASSSPESEASPTPSNVGRACAEALGLAQGFILTTMNAPAITDIAERANQLLDGIVTQATQAGLAGSLIEELSPAGERQRVLEFASGLDPLELPKKSGLLISELPGPLQEVVLKVVRLYVDQAPEALQKNLIRSVELFDQEEAQIYLRLQGSDRVGNLDRAWFIFVKAEGAPSFVIEWVAIDDLGVDIQSILRVQNP